MGMAAVMATMRGSLSASSTSVLAKTSAVCGHAGRLGHAGFRIVGPEAVEFLLAVERGLKAAALLREDVQQDGVVLGLEELEGLDQQRQVVAVDGAEVFQAELLKQDGGPQHALGGFFGAAHDLDGGLAAEALDDARAPSRAGAGSARW